jgi:predicted transposase YdaD
MLYITSVEQIGYDRGIKEGQEEKAIAIGLNLLRQGIPIEVIAQATGLTVHQLQRLQAQVN